MLVEAIVVARSVATAARRPSSRYARRPWATRSRLSQVRIEESIVVAVLAELVPGRSTRASRPPSREAPNREARRCPPADVDCDAFVEGMASLLAGGEAHAPPQGGHRLLSGTRPEPRACARHGASAAGLWCSAAGAADAE